MSFTGFAFYIAVRCGFDKHLYLTSCLNAHNHNTFIRLPQTGCTVRNMALFIGRRHRLRRKPSRMNNLRIDGVAEMAAETWSDTEAVIFRKTCWSERVCVYV